MNETLFGTFQGCNQIRSESQKVIAIRNCSFFELKAISLLFPKYF